MTKTTIAQARSLTDQLESVTAERDAYKAERDKCGSGAGCLHKDAMIDSLTAELAECKTEQVETRRKHREDYEALHDAVAERNELKAKLADMRKVWLGAQCLIAELKAKMAAFEEQEPVQAVLLADMEGCIHASFGRGFFAKRFDVKLLHLAAGAREPVKEKTT